MSANALRWTLIPMILMLAACGGGSSGGRGGEGGGEGKPLPSIQITTPVNGATVTGSRSITVTGTGVNMDSVEVKLDGAVIPAADVSTTVTGFTAKVTLGDNVNTIEAVATNANGRASSGVVTVTFPFARLTTFQPASVVVGQADFTHGGQNEGGISAATLYQPWGSPLVHGGKLYVGDYGNNRVLVFDPVPSANGASASLVLGQPDLATSIAGTTASQWTGPQTVVADESGKLLVMEYANNRVLILNTVPIASTPAADLVVGQADLTSSAMACTQTGLSEPESVFTVGGKLLVADSGNNRVLVWNSIPTRSGAPADLVLGQADFTHCATNAGSEKVSAGGLANPTDVWSDGTRLAVVDQGNHRVLIWNTFPTVNGTPADLAVGQADLVSRVGGAGQAQFSGPRMLASNGNQLVVTDVNNARVLIWNTFPTSSGALPDVVLGQGDFGRSQYNDDDQDGEAEGPTARTLRSPTGVTLHGGQLFVSDSDNNRLLVYDAP